MTNARSGFTIWFTGLPCSGKSTLARRVAEELRRCGRESEILDGDGVRQRLSKGLGYSKEDRDENIRRIGYVCSLLSKHGAVAIAAAISPYRAIRDEVRAAIPHFVEVYVKASADACARRDVKGLYKKALAGEIKNFTGVNDPYEPPVNPEVVVDTEEYTVQECVSAIIARLETLGLLERAPVPDITPEEAEKIRSQVMKPRHTEPNPG